MKFELTLIYFDEDGEELTSSTDLIHADDLEAARIKAESLFVASTADDYKLDEI